MTNSIKSYINNYALEILFVVSSAATLSSLILSNVLGYPPCDLCWYQRIFMFPLPLIYGAGLVLKDRKALYYGLPLIVAGAVLAFYHNLLQWGIVSENVLECSFTSVSCADPLINWFGFMTIPLGSLAIFLALAILTKTAIQAGKLSAKTDAAGANRVLYLAGALLLVTAISMLIINWFR